jgi:creatinine amidohydrolase
VIGSHRMELLELTSPAVAALDRDTPVVLPIAALEQHGRHLPVFTDSLLLGEVLRRAKPHVADRVLFAPLYWLGNSEHHLDFTGTMSASPRGYLDSLRDMAENFLVHGFRRIVFVNGHGGNIVPAQQATFELRQKYRSRSDLLLLSVTYWTAGADPRKDVAGLHQDRMGHACEWETSMILRLAPQLVAGDVKQVPDVPFGRAFEPAHRAWVMPDRSAPGHIGYPRYATAEKGEGLFESFSRAVAALLKRVLEWDGREWDV